MTGELWRFLNVLHRFTLSCLVGSLLEPPGRRSLEAPASIVLLSDLQISERSFGGRCMGF